jgi:hypothetical protein
MCWLARSRDSDPKQGVEPSWRSGPPLFNNVQTITVCRGHLGLDRLLVKQLQQGVVHGHLAVPLATLDNEFYHINEDASDGFQVFIK